MTLSPTHIVLMILASVVVTPLPVLLIPHARQSTAFDRLLWGGTLVTAFLGTWLGIANWSVAIPEPSINSVPILPIVAGALVGAIILNALLFVLDHLEKPAEPDDAEPDGAEPVEVLPPEEEGTIEPEPTEIPQQK